MNRAYREGFLHRCASFGIPDGAAVYMLKRAEADQNLARATAIFKDWLTVPKHTVRRGEVLSGVASKYGVGLKELMAENNMASTLVQPGQVLRIPRTESKQCSGGRAKTV